MNDMFDLSIAHHALARKIEAAYGVDHEEAIAQRRNGDHMAQRAQLYERSQRKMRRVANDV